jgi:hypothetical protein
MHAIYSDVETGKLESLEALEALEALEVERTGLFEA